MQGEGLRGGCLEHCEPALFKVAWRRAACQQRGGVGGLRVVLVPRCRRAPPAFGGVGRGGAVRACTDPRALLKVLERLVHVRRTRRPAPHVLRGVRACVARRGAAQGGGRRERRGRSEGPSRLFAARGPGADRPLSGGWREKGGCRHRSARGGRGQGSRWCGGLRASPRGPADRKRPVHRQPWEKSLTSLAPQQPRGGAGKNEGRPGAASAGSAPTCRPSGPGTLPRTLAPAGPQDTTHSARAHTRRWGAARGARRPGAARGPSGLFAARSASADPLLSGGLGWRGQTSMSTRVW
jgi:hypothetical protein